MHMAKKTAKTASAKGAAKAPETAKAPMEKEVARSKPAVEQKPAQELGESSWKPAKDQPAMASTPAVQPSPKPAAGGAEGKREQGGLVKGIMIFGLLAAVLFLAYYFMALSENSFVPGIEVDAETFKGIFTHSTNVFIVMDVRGASNTATANNILQCGVDFAASSGMGGKEVTPISFGNDGCVTPDGFRKPKECFAMLKDGTTIYVRDGPGGAKYYSNGMVVFVGPEYALGTCGIKAT